METPDNVDDALLDGFLNSLELNDLRERYKIKPENFETRLDLQCYLLALQITATDKDFFMPIIGKPKMGKSTLGIQIGIKTIEALRKKPFSVNIPEFNVETDIHYPPISENEMMDVIDNAKPPVMMFDRAIFNDDTLLHLGFDSSEIKEIEEGTCIYFSNMKTRKTEYNKFEGDVTSILQKAFVYDILFSNPLMPEKEYKEFCDILINFFDSGVIFQCKECNIDDPERMTRKTIVKGLNQLKTSVNRARNKSVKLFMVNSIKVFKDYNFADIIDIHPILVVNRKLSFLNYNAIKESPEIKKLDFVPIILTIEDLKFLVAELDTPSDLFTYFKRREEFITKTTMQIENEIELLSYYLLNNKSFEQRYVSSRYGVISGFYEEYISGKFSELFVKKKKLDEISYWVDNAIKGAYLSREPNYLKGLEEILKLNRVQRRKLALLAEEKRNNSIKEGRDRWGLTIYQEKPDMAFVVYFTADFNEKTQPWFYAMCACAQYKTNVKKVIGLAQTTANNEVKRTMGIYFEKSIEHDVEEDAALKKLCDGFWGDGRNSTYSEFVE